jgi:hypothetical protein
LTDADFKAIKPWLLFTDISMLTDWGLTCASGLGLLEIPSEWLYSDYDNPLVIAWNWSFFPLDLTFSLAGVGATWLHSRNPEGWKVLLAISLVLTWCAGFMAVSFWVIRADFDPLWWAANLFLVVWPMAFFPRIWRSTHAGYQR